MKVYLIHKKYLVDDYYDASEVVAVALREEDTESAIQKHISDCQATGEKEYKFYLEQISPEAQRLQREKTLTTLRDILARCQVGSNRYKRHLNLIKAQEEAESRPLYPTTPEEEFLQSYIPSRDKFFVEEMEAFSG